MKENLKKYEWGLGLEHETQMFLYDNEKYKYLHVIPNLEKEIIKYDLQKKETNWGKELQTDIPLEKTGRMCQGKLVLEKTPINMPEFITREPMSNMKMKSKIFENRYKTGMDYFYNLYREEEQFLTENVKDKVSQLKKTIDSQNNTEGTTIIEYPFGMCKYIRTIKKILPNKLLLSKKVYKDYVGSFHITITLPYKKNKKGKYTKKEEEEFILNHQKMANCIQWLEPLLLTAYFSVDQDAMGKKEDKIKGSFRVMKAGWGNFGGSDVRRFNEGIGRYANIPSYWRENLNYKETKLMENLCGTAPPPEGETGAISRMAGDFRTFGNTDPKRPWHRTSGAPMNIPNGIEIRIFDHFPTFYLYSLIKLIVYIAENSRKCDFNMFVYKDKDWIENLGNIMKNGWKTELTNNYIEKLRNVLKLEIKTNNRQAYKIFEIICKELYNKNKNGDWVILMLNDKTEIEIPKLNRESWEYAFNLELIKNKKLLEKSNNLLKLIKTGDNIEKYKEKFEKIFESKWYDDYLDILYYFESYKLIKIKNNNIIFINKKLNIDYLNIINYSLLLPSLFIIFDPDTIFKYINTLLKKNIKNKIYKERLVYILKFLHFLPKIYHVSNANIIP
jgi:hypothetical protein